MDWNSQFIWLQFAFFAGLIIFAGMRLTRSGDEIAQRTGLGRIWVGVVLLSVVTSLPEVVTSCSAAYLGEPDIAIENVLGSNLFNILILVALDLAVRGRAVLAGAGRGHVATALSGAMMMLLVAAAVLIFHTAQDHGYSFHLYTRSPYGLDSVIILFLYLWIMRRIFMQGRQEQKKQRANADSKGHTAAAPSTESQKSLLSVLVPFIVSAAIIVIAGYRMSYLGKVISETSFSLGGLEFRLTESFVGMILIAIATSLPELAVTLSAVRIGATEMAIGNVLGSNVFNVAIIGLADLFYLHGPILLYTQRAVAATAVFGVILVALVIGGFYRRSDRPVFGRLGLSTTMILVVYLAGMFLMWRAGWLVA